MKSCKDCLFLKAVKNRDHNFICRYHEDIEIFNSANAGCENRQDNNIIIVLRDKHLTIDRKTNKRRIA